MNLGHTCVKTMQYAEHRRRLRGSPRLYSWCWRLLVRWRRWQRWRRLGFPEDESDPALTDSEIENFDADWNPSLFWCWLKSLTLFAKCSKCAALFGYLPSRLYTNKHTLPCSRLYTNTSKTLPYPLIPHSAYTPTFAVFQQRAKLVPHSVGIWFWLLESSSTCSSVKLLHRQMDLGGRHGHFRGP